MPPVFDDSALRDLLAPLSGPAGEFASAYPGESFARQPVHTVYGGAHLFADDTARKLGERALGALEEYAPDFATFARAIGLQGADRLPSVPAERTRFEARVVANEAAIRTSEPQAFLAHALYTRLRAKLAREPVEDYRIDFEDGYGPRPGDEEAGHAVAAAEAMARANAAGSLPPFSGIRIRPLDASTGERALRTLDLFLSTLLARTHGALPPNFVVTLPKVSLGSQVEVLSRALTGIERAHGLDPGALRCELMVETPQALIDESGRVPLRALVAAASGRCRGVHLGAYDFTASLGVTASNQALEHPAAAFARRLAQVALAGTGQWLSDGAVTRLPVPPHRGSGGAPLATAQVDANRTEVHGAWRAHGDSVRRALQEGCYQGWDLHPLQLVSRHAATIGFFLEGRDAAASRLEAFVGRSAKATLHGNVLDDAATGQGLLNFFLRGIACGALGESDVRATGLTLEEMRGRSFASIVSGRGR